MHGYLWDGLCSTSGASGVFGYGGMWFLVGIGLLLIVGLIVWFVVSQRTTQPQGGGTAQVFGAPRPTGEDAESIARTRLARGEIDADEYARIIAALRG
ncbi:MAG: hypothetical protein Kow0067_15370 [Coriobacteriia bacterium]